MAKYREKECVVCGTSYCSDPHEPYGGRNRQLSIKYGLVVDICRTCHRALHDDPEHKVNKPLREQMKAKFEKEHPELDFIEIFK